MKTAVIRVYYSKFEWHTLSIAVPTIVECPATHWHARLETCPPPRLSTKQVPPLRQWYSLPGGQGNVWSPCWAMSTEIQYYYFNGR